MTEDSSDQVPAQGTPASKEGHAPIRLGLDVARESAGRMRPYRALHRDNVRAYLALGLVASLVALILILGLRAPVTTWEQFMQLAQLLIAALTGMTGIAVGFYLGRDRNGTPP